MTHIYSISFSIHLDVYHTKQNQLVLSCRARANPLPVIEWTKDDNPIVLDERIEQAETLEGICELIINDPTPADSGYYAVSATNNLGSVEQEHLVMFPQLVDKIKTIVFDPPEDEIVEGQAASVSVLAVPATVIKAVTPEPAAAAAVKAVPLATATAAVVVVPAPEVPLNIPDPELLVEATPEPEEAPVELLMPPHRPLRIEPRYVLNVDADYVRRHVPPSMEDIQRIIKTKLSFATYLTNRLFALGSHGRLSCVVRGPDPNAKWTKDGQPIVNGPIYKTNSNDGLFTLEFAGECKPEHAGTYEITVRNGDCTISSDCKVSVFQPQLVADLVPTFTRNLKREYSIHKYI